MTTVEPGRRPADDDALDAIVVDAEPEGPPSTTPIELSVGRGVIVDVVRAAALEIPDVLRPYMRGIEVITKP